MTTKTNVEEKMNAVLRGTGSGCYLRLSVNMAEGSMETFLKKKQAFHSNSFKKNALVFHFKSDPD